ncbi:lysophospholipid acyltransferase family protein [Mycoplasmopsis hyopharyngis]|uniref:lysophospholipid acyltransferase family protein n=1 Tax=Mycoplasmopsis hyopharyngis TaxID=29558 RepID=UPI003873AA30
MNFNAKMIFLWPSFVWKWLRLMWKAKSYKRNPDGLFPMERNDLLLKYSKKLIKWFNIKLNVEGYENLPNNGPVLLIPNHKSNIDAILVLAALESKRKSEGIPNKMPCFLAKSELQKSKTTKNVLSLLDTIYIDRNNIRASLASLNEFGKFIKDYQRFGVIFPEGARIYEDGLGEFKPGAFKVALKEYLPIIPVAITDTRDALNKKRSKKLPITVKFLPQIKPNNFLSMDTKFLAEKVKGLIANELENLKEQKN